MSIRTAAWIAWSTLAFACSCELFGLYFQAANGDDQFMRDVFYALAVLAFPAVGALVAARRPANPIGWIFCAVVSAIFGYAALQYGMYALVTQPGALPGGVWMAWLGNWAGNPGFNTIFTFTLLLFPDGQLPSPRWRPVAWLAGGVIALDALSAALAPGPLSNDVPFNNPVGIAGLAGASGFVQGLIEGPFGLTIVAACAISVLVRFRRAQGIERQQIKWFAYAAGVLIVVGTLGTFLPFLPGLLKDVLFTFAVGSLPVAVGIAILRYRLYDIDLIIRRTLVYGVLTAVLALVYLGSVVLLQVIFRALTGETSQAAIVASTLAIAALFTPLRRRIQTTIDRRFYRRKYDAAKTLAAFSAQLRDEVDLNALTGELLAVIAETIQPAHVSLWLREAPHRSSRDPKITRA